MNNLGTTLSISFFLVLSSYCQSNSYINLLDLEKEIGNRYKNEYFNSTGSLSTLKSLTSKSWRKYSLTNLHEIKNKLDNFTYIYKKINHKELQNYKNEITLISTKIELLRHEIGKPNASLEKAKVYMQDLLNELQRADRKLNKIIDNANEDDRTSFASDILRQAAKVDHTKLLKDGEFTSAQNCRKCHPDHFNQWAMSQHAYAQLSPIYMSMQKTVNHLTNKTNGDFCIRCHTQVGMIKNESIYASNLERHPMSREGVSCIVCHRISPGDNESSLEYGKVNARLSLQKSDLKGTVYGPKPSDDVEKEIEDSGYKKIHNAVGKFSRMSTAGFCSSCHDAVLGNGLRLEEAFSEYQNSTAAEQNVSCQDCHMGTSPGRVILDEFGKVAKENYRYSRISKPSSRDRKMTDHTFSGPDFTVIHPALFPHSYSISKMADIKEWLTFKYSEGWGSKRWEEETGREKENLLYKDFWPQKEKLHRWMYRSDRENARNLIIDQFTKLREARRRRLQLLRRGYQFKTTKQSDVIDITKEDGELNFNISIKNGTNAHNVPTDLVTERLIWLHVTVRKEDSNEIVFESGDLDPNGDLRDIHSFFVHNNDKRWQKADGHGGQRLLFTPQFSLTGDIQLPVELDKQLFNLQSKFITKNIRGGEREQILGVNHSIDTLPFIRPSTSSAILKGQPGDVRIHRLSLPPKTSRKASYTIEKEKLRPGRYTINVKLKSAIVPINLIKAISIVGFDYGMTPKQVASRVVFGFEKELNAIRYYAITSKKELQKIVTNNKYLSKAFQKYGSAMKVLTEQNAKELKHQATVRFYAEDVALKKINYIKERIAETDPGKNWLNSEEFKFINQRLQQNPLDELYEIKTFLSEKCLSSISPQDKNRIMKIIEIIDEDRDKETYWSPIEHRQVENGLLSSKVGGHEVLHSAQKTVQIK